MWRLDRLGQDLKDLLTFVNELHEGQVQFVSHIESMNTPPDEPVGLSDVLFPGREDRGTDQRPSGRQTTGINQGQATGHSGPYAR